MKSMKTTIQRILVITASLLSSLAVSQAQFTAGDLVVVRVGDGITTLISTGDPISLLEINTGGTLIGPPISVPSGTGGLQISGVATSEGQLVLNASHTALTLAGYVPPFTGSGSLSGRTAAQAPRGYVTIDYNRNVSATTTLPGSSTYSTDNIRSVFASGTSLWFSGSKNGTPSGVVYYDGASSSSVSNVNSRVLNDFNNNLYYSTGSGVTGIYKYSGLPTTSTASTAVITGVAGQGVNPYDFALSPDGLTMYVADSDLGVQKFTFNGLSWTLSYNFTDADTSGSKAFGLAVDFSGSNPVIYWSSPNDIWTATDPDSGSSNVAGTALLTAGTDYAFRGLDFSPEPVPEPSTLALVGMGLISLCGFARRNRKS
jgi:hypothetical protein